MFVQFAPGVPRTEIWRALHGAASLQADIGKYVIAVSEDIDPENTERGVLVFSWPIAPIRSRTCRSRPIARRAMVRNRAGMDSIRPC